ncbi:uncharacterized protein EV420DRAFT_1513855 [Desarmillaria tabescens]|uniref:Secreted protein n=1 Tax=Armillaria tabescens TaxID=1929756 RepID=A0AA39TNQ5_ARMTA|nr:uncharacterized protein EV420DRAFT_1513855 [Desarmillaria tabescens]KAK0465312.1 hypothetical protein EV420DRAFT_1513855 [Desarmillaria tabescens]
MIFMGFLLLAFEPNGCKAVATEGNGRRAREEGKDGFRRGIILFACPEVHDEPASGDEIVGRDMVKDAKTRKWSVRGRQKRKKRTHCACKSSSGNRDRDTQESESAGKRERRDE